MKQSVFDLSDDEIIYKIRHENSSKYFEVLYRRYQPKVIGKCYTFVKNKELAKEFSDEIFAKVFEKLISYKQMSSFSSWLYSITYNHCIDYMRKNKKMNYPKWNQENELPEIIEDTDEIVNEISYDNLLEIMELIHPEEKALLFMKYKDELSMKQISEALRISEDAAKMRIKRARSRVLFLYSQKYFKD